MTPAAALTELRVRCDYCGETFTKNLGLISSRARWIVRIIRAGDRCEDHGIYYAGEADEE